MRPPCMVPTTKDQRKAVYAVYQRDTTVTETYKEFRQTVRFGFGCIMLPWHGMWLGIEPDGYTHS